MWVDKVSEFLKGSKKKVIQKYFDRNIFLKRYWQFYIC